MNKTYRVAIPTPEGVHLAYVHGEAEDKDYGVCIRKEGKVVFLASNFLYLIEVDESTSK